MPYLGVIVNAAYAKHIWTLQNKIGFPETHLEAYDDRVILPEHVDCAFAHLINTAGRGEHNNLNVCILSIVYYDSFRCLYGKTRMKFAALCMQTNVFRLEINYYWFMEVLSEGRKVYPALLHTTDVIKSEQVLCARESLNEAVTKASEKIYKGRLANDDDCFMIPKIILVSAP